MARNDDQADSRDDGLKLDVPALIRSIPGRSVLAMSIALFTVATLVLFVNEDRFGLHGLGELRKPFAAWLWGGWALGLIGILSFASRAIEGLVAGWLEHRSSVNALQHLPPDQKAILRLFVESGTGTQHFKQWSGPVASLHQARILYPVEGGSRGGYEFNIELWAFHYLEKYPALIGLPVGWRRGSPPPS